MEPASERAALIGLDWGTTSFRGYRMDGEGHILDRVDSDSGILAVADGDFAAALRHQIGHWLTEPEPPPVIACGMIGSRQGWHETPYVDLPAGVDALAGTLVAVEPAGSPPVHFVPGLSRRDAQGVPDVMRGEETQLIGAASADAGPSLFVLPGTHSKWAVVSHGRIEWFATFMTGELFAVLSRHSILGRLMSGRDHDPASFRRGLDRAMSNPGDGPGLLHTLFGTRSLPLFGDVPETGVASYLSGLLIGTEIAGATRNPAFEEAFGSATLIGRSALAEHYADALAAAGLDAKTADPDACAAGLYRLAAAAGILTTEMA